MLLLEKKNYSNQVFFTPKLIYILQLLPIAHSQREDTEGKRVNLAKL